MSQLIDRSAPRNEKIHALTSLRFFAALYVVCYHTVWTFLPWIRREQLLGRFLNLGYISVSFFFLLSGYILGIVYLRRGAPVRLADFYRARFARVYPLFFLTILLDIPSTLQNWTAHYGVKSALVKTFLSFTGTAAMLQGYRMQFTYINFPSWSLSAETFFYLIFPFIGIALWKLSGTRLWMAAICIYCAGMSLVYLAFHHIPVDPAKRLPFLHVSTFALGIVLARWQMLRHSRQSQPPRSAGSGVSRYLVFLVTLGILAAVIYWSRSIPEVILCDGLLAPLFICWIWVFSDSDWSAAKLLNAPWLVVLGEASFGLYLIHIPVFHLIDWLGINHGPVLFVLYLGLCIALSVLSFYFYEGPMRRLILKRRPLHLKETLEMASDAQ